MPSGRTAAQTGGDDHTVGQDRGAGDREKYAACADVVGGEGGATTNENGQFLEDAALVASFKPADAHSQRCV